jgi:hypothetical protein
MHRIRNAVALITLMGCAAVAAPTFAQDRVTRGLRTGDAWVDATLGDVNQYGARYPDALADELARYYDAPRDLVETLLTTKYWTAGDVFYACALAHAAGQPCRTVTGIRERGEDWRAISARMGVAPGSEQFQRLKRDLVLSYAHWARPLQVDGSLHAEFPDLPVAHPSEQEKPGAPAALSEKSAHARRTP